MYCALRNTHTGVLLRLMRLGMAQLPGELILLFPSFEFMLCDAQAWPAWVNRCHFGSALNAACPAALQSVPPSTTASTIAKMTDVAGVIGYSCQATRCMAYLASLADTPDAQFCRTLQGLLTLSSEEAFLHYGRVENRNLLAHRLTLSTA